MINIDYDMRKKLAELLSYGEDGKKAFIELCTKFFPKEIHKAIIEMANGNLTEREFLEKINNDALDSYSNNKDENLFKILEASEGTRKEFSQ